MSVEKILNKLQKVKRSGNNSWLACCSAHDDRSPSLSITDNGDGKVMLRCFAGCETIDVLNAIGLDWEDVMPPKTQYTQTNKPVKHTLYATDALDIVRTEAQIIVMAAIDITKGVKIGEGEMARIATAISRINTVLEATKNAK